MMEQAVTITDTDILILGQFFVHKDYSITRKDILLDILGKHYAGQKILIRLWDGENFDFSGFDHYIKFLCDTVQIPYNNVTIETHNPDPNSNFKTNCLSLGIFVSVNQYLPTDINRNVDNAKFVGSLLGRYNLNRFRLAYELDQAFPNDTYITFQPKVSFVQDSLKHFNSQYAQELAWLEQKTFDRDLDSTHFMGMIDWYDACRNYNNVWNQYQIEIISETDSISDFWFTEKTANCLATGKPFVLVSGEGSLARLRDMGFQTFDSVIDESYDLAKHPYDRIKRLISSLQVLYNSSSRQQQMDSLYQLASKNCELYNKYIQTVKKS
jgi:hypothetical protein